VDHKVTKTNLKLCILSQDDIVNPPGGIGTYVRNLGVLMVSRGHEVHVIVRKNPGTPDFEKFEGVFVHRVPAPGPAVLYSLFYFWNSRKKFFELHLSDRFDLVQGHLPIMSSWGLRGSGLPPIVETIHCTVDAQLSTVAKSSLLRLNTNEVFTRFLSPLFYFQEKNLLSRAKITIAVSNGLKKEIIDKYGIPAQKITAIPNGIDIKKFSEAASLDKVSIRHRLGINSDEKVILYLGRLMEGKRVVDLVYALDRVRQNIPQTRLAIVGKINSNSNRIKQIAQQLGLEDRVTFFGHVPYQDVPLYYAMADVYALPSAYEGFPFTILEAMAAGTPVVASSIPGIIDQVIPEENGLLHPVGDIDVLSKQLFRVIEDERLSSKLTQSAREMVIREYDWQVIGDRTEAVFRDLVHSEVR
jgi:glycosyltransferase involved in cell wall biosynthesis